jgi:hypothetical protein
MSSETDRAIPGNRSEIRAIVAARLSEASNGREDVTMSQEITPLMNQVPQRAGSTSHTWVIWGGLITSGLTLLGVWAVARSTEFDLMGWYANYVLPMGAFIVGLLAGSGYGLAAWLSNRRVGTALLWCVAGLQVVVYFAAQYIEFRHEVAGDPELAGVSFLTYFDFYTQNAAWQDDDGSLGEPFGLWGYAFRLLEIGGFAVGGIIAPLIMRMQPYCEACSVYMKGRDLGLLPAGVQPRKVKKSDVEGTQAYEQELEAAFEEALGTVNLLAERAAAGDIEGLEQTLAPFEPRSRKHDKLTARIRIKLNQCPRCDAGEMIATALTGKGDKVVQTEIVRVPLFAPLPADEGADQPAAG